MTIETSLYTALKSLVADRIYRDIAPSTVTTLPRITFQAVGGESINFLDSATVPNKRFQRVQVNVWHNQRDAANALAIQVEETLKAYAVLQATSMGAFVAVHETETGLYGTIQDFSVFG